MFALLSETDFMILNLSLWLNTGGYSSCELVRIITYFGNRGEFPSVFLLRCLQDCGS